jgi:hypothetical protein
MGPLWHGDIAGHLPSPSGDRRWNRCDVLRPQGLVRRPNLAGPAGSPLWEIPQCLRIAPHIVELEPVHAVEF